MRNKDKRWKTPTQADLRLLDKKGDLLTCKVRNSTSEAWIHGHILTDIDLVGKYPFQTYDTQGKYRKWKWCVIQDDRPDPKFLIGSSVTCDRIGIDTQCIVLHYNENDGDGIPEYTVYPATNSGKTYDCREDELKPWVEPTKQPVECQACGLDISGSTWCSAQKPGCPMPDRPKDGSPRWFDPVQDNQTYTNEKSGKQSFLSARFDCIPPVVLRLLAQCLGFGARKYGKDNWKQIEQWDHLSHALNHINEWNRGNRDEPHLVNAMARLTFALWQAVESKEQPDTYIHPDEVK